MNAGCGSAPLADWPQSKAKAVRARQARNADATGAPLAGDGLAMRLSKKCGLSWWRRNACRERSTVGGESSGRSP